VSRQANTLVRLSPTVLGARLAALAARPRLLAKPALVALATPTRKRIDTVHARAIILARRELTVVHILLALLTPEPSRALTNGLFADELAARLPVHSLV